MSGKDSLELERGNPCLWVNPSTTVPASAHREHHELPRVEQALHN